VSTHSHTKYVIFLFIGMMPIMLPFVYAENYDVAISAGSSFEDCKFDKTCYEPYQITIVRTDVITWTNLDNAVHTVTGGNPDSGPDGSFDSGLLTPSKTFSQTFHMIGNFEYYCTLHPWMTGVVFVEGGQIRADLSFDQESIKIVTQPDNMPRTGNALSFIVDVQNFGEDDAIPAQFRLQVIDERGAIVHQLWHDAELKSKTMTTLTYDWTPETRGIYKVIFDADFTKRVIESDEANNHYEMIVKVIDADSILTKSVSSDGTINVYVESDPPKVGEEMYMYVAFTDTNEKKIKYINYAITGKQDGELIFFTDNAYEAEGEGLHITKTLDSESPVDIQVTILGIGLQGDQNNWSGPKGEVVSLQVIPEFPIALLVLASTIGMLVIFTTKTHRLIQSAR